MNNKISAVVSLMIASLIIGASIGLAIRSNAQTQTPNPGCGYIATVPWSPCAANPPVPGNFWTPIDGIPGTMGPHGYTPKIG